ncbi:hypothetical protein NQZ68_037713 [Dissostichus eleginoides]|nr:hypothetical protein NQZ68_037713 [Dissostichus eleginoides]
MNRMNVSHSHSHDCSPQQSGGELKAWIREQQMSSKTNAPPLNGATAREICKPTQQQGQKKRQLALGSVLSENFFFSFTPLLLYLHAGSIARLSV